VAGWRLLDVGAVDGYVMTNLYEAVGIAVSEGVSPNTLILNHPESPFANVGYHQEVEREIDVDYCRSQGIPIVRRSIGGGAILDGPWEQDYFVIIRRDDPECPASVPDFYQKFLKPIVYALKSYGLKAEFRPLNDVLVSGKKISGNGAIGIENSSVLAGDILLDFPVDLMVRVLKVPSEKFRGKIAKSMQEWLTSMKNELGHTPEREEVKERIVEGFEKELGIKFERGELTGREKELLEKLLNERRSESWIFRKKLSHERLYSAPKCTKIRGGVYVCEGMHKAEKLVRVTVEFQEDVIKEISISGDFFTQPYIGGIAQLEKELVDTPAEKEKLKARIEDAIRKIGLKIYGVKTEDIVEAIMKAKQAKEPTS